jgi:hypothetical protein
MPRTCRWKPAGEPETPAAAEIVALAPDVILAADTVRPVSGVFRGHDRGGPIKVIALEPRGKGLPGITLRYPYEVRNEADYFDDIPDTPAQVVAQGKIPLSQRQISSCESL